MPFFCYFCSVHFNVAIFEYRAIKYGFSLSRKKVETEPKLNSFGTATLLPSVLGIYSVFKGVNHLSRVWPGCSMPDCLTVVIDSPRGRRSRESQSHLPRGLPAQLTPLTHAAPRPILPLHLWGQCQSPGGGSCSVVWRILSRPFFAGSAIFWSDPPFFGLIRSFGPDPPFI